MPGNSDQSHTPPEPPGVPPGTRSPEDRLDSWKEIASYLNRDVTTVQRWEKREGMPVYRHQHGRMGSVYASRSELDAWVRSRNAASAEAESGAADVPLPGAASPATREHRSISRFKLIAALALSGALLVTTLLWLRSTEYFWRNPLAGARVETLTEFDGPEQAAAVSRDGRFVAFLSDRDGAMDVWLTQVGTGRFHNLTRGSAAELINPSVRTLGFSPDGSLVTFWVRRPDGSRDGAIGIWAVPTLGGQPRPYLEGAAELDWSVDGSRLVYHTPGPGDPMFVSDGASLSKAPAIFTAPAGIHSHFPLWSPDSAFIYFVRGSIPDHLDIWRMRVSGRAPERITSHTAQVSHPVLLDSRTLLYLAGEPDGSGPWIYSMNVERRIPHRLSSGLDRYTSLSASADGRRLVATRSSPRRTLWKLPLGSSPSGESEAARISLSTSTAVSPRLGPDFLVYVSGTGSSESIWKITEGAATELWSGVGAQIIGGPAVSFDGGHIAFSVRRSGRTLLYAMNADGTDARVVTDRLELQGAPAWEPGGRAITSAAIAGGVPRLYRVPLENTAPTRMLEDYSVDPVWSPDGRFVLYTGPDIGTTLSVKAVNPSGVPHRLPPLTLTRGARRLVFLPEARALVFLRGHVQQKNLWLLDLTTGAERQLTDFAPDFNIRDFDVSPDGRELVVERLQDRSDVVVLDLARR